MLALPTPPASVLKTQNPGAQPKLMVLDITFQHTGPIVTPRVLLNKDFQQQAMLQLVLTGIPAPQLHILDYYICNVLNYPVIVHNIIFLLPTLTGS